VRSDDAAPSAAVGRRPAARTLSSGPRRRAAGAGSSRGSSSEGRLEAGCEGGVGAPPACRRSGDGEGLCEQDETDQEDIDEVTYCYLCCLFSYIQFNTVCNLHSIYYLWI